MVQMLNENPKVSICIPNYNYGNYIGDAIQSVLDQSFTDFELIIVDNCSTDDSENVIQKFTDRRIKYFKNETNIGAIRNCNKCVYLAKGEYIFLLHADDQMMPNLLEKEAKILDEHPNVGLVCSSYILKTGTYTKSVASSNNDYIADGIDEFKKHIVKGYLVWATMMTRRDCYETIGLYDENMQYAVDGDMIVRILLKYDLAYVSKPMICRTSHGNSWGNSYNDYYKMNMAMIDRIKLLRKTFTNLPANLINLTHLERLAMKNLAKGCILSAFFNIKSGEIFMARKDLLLSLMIDKYVLLNPLLYFVYVCSFFGKFGASSIESVYSIIKSIGVWEIK